MAGKSTDYPKAQMKSARALGVQEASGLARLGDGSFLVVDDEHGIFRCMPDGSSAQLEAGKGLSDLEGIAITPDGASAFVLSENDGSIWRFAIDKGDLHEGGRLGELPQLSKERNHGWEGIAIAPAGTFAARMLLVAVHQTDPRRVGLFDTETLQQNALLRLPRDAREAIGELNGVAVDAGGRILLLSGKIGRIAEMRLEDGSLATVSVYRIETSKNDVPEGISIDAKGRVWVCTDGKGMLRQLELLP
jgi:sugar lactone lactonase YvrE